MDTHSKMVLLPGNPAGGSGIWLVELQARPEDLIPKE